MNGRKLFYGEVYQDFYSVCELMNYNDAVGSIKCYDSKFDEQDLIVLLEQDLADLQTFQSRGIMHLFWPRSVLDNQETYPPYTLFYGVLLEP